VDHAITVLYWLLALFGLVFLVGCIRAIRTAAVGERILPTPYQILVGLVTDFFDTLGIGSFATTTALYRARGTIDDRLLPGTLNVGHTLATIAQAYLFFTSVEVDPTTLVAMIAAAVVGAWTGAGFVAKWPRRRVRSVMGVALLAIGAVIVVRQLNDPKGGDARGVTGLLLAAGVAGNFVLGVLMTMGIGLYAPCLLLVCLLGMNPTTGFPIMMGSCAFLMPLASLRFLREKSCDLRACAGLTLGGVPAVFAAVWVFDKIQQFEETSRQVEKKSMHILIWVVLVVVLYTAISLLLAARRSASGAGVGGERPPAA
jgi:uncharacterized membrane protein YfcA